MQTVHNGIPRDADRFDYVQSLLARYPEVAATELDDLKHWFNKEASALEVASLASNERIHAQYAAFRAGHIDPFKPQDFMAAALAILIAAICIFYLAL